MLVKITKNSNGEKSTCSGDLITILSPSKLNSLGNLFLTSFGYASNFQSAIIAQSWMFSASASAQLGGKILISVYPGYL